MSFASYLRPTLAASLLMLASLGAVPASARETRKATERERPVRTVEPEASEPAGAWTAGTAPAAECTRARRKLWQAEQGWIVKTITTCH